MKDESLPLSLVIALLAAYSEVTPTFLGVVWQRKIEWRFKVKYISTILLTMVLAGCSSMGSSGTSDPGSPSNLGNRSESEKPYSQRVPQPGDLYFGD
jgi:hypothetical protein